MPLDDRKAQHLLRLINRSYAGRQRSLVAVVLNAGCYSYRLIQGIIRPLHCLDPQVYDSSGQPPRPEADHLLIAPLGTDFSGVVYLADCTVASAGAVAAATKYELIEAVPVGLLPGGTHLRVPLRRLR
ncbi:hypothetical protein KTAU_06530 [Thermogemmatispora aurantia]|uniref:Uncharacterized protein n=1 Tax=Thermogemmatispora aurantia TaxID=2045279 RepID=A0A5J4K301_9CHLR|nr:hypothetical protein [Thermogemmatispora aurantia]GER82015.1 hypothetical protein KTAU_06530 [Thermogemmatispora aurantia]